jgi:hypothetical protein
MRLSNRYTDSKDRCILVVRDPAMRALILQAIEEQARTSWTSTQLQDKYEGFNLKIKMVGFRIQSDKQFIQHVLRKAVAIANSMKQNPTSGGGYRSLM